MFCRFEIILFVSVQRSSDETTKHDHVKQIIE